MNDAVNLLRKCINKKIYLKRENKKWQLSENDVTIKFKVPSKESLGFRLDAEKIKDVFGFFAGDPPKHVSVMCDGIIVLNYKKQAYVVLLEQKTNSKIKYRKQLINGWYFCQWLFSLLKEHNHYSGKVKYIGLLYRARQSVSKGTSTHQKPLAKKPEKNGIKFFETNEKLTQLITYI